MVELEARLPGLRNLKQKRRRVISNRKDIADAYIPLVEVFENQIFAEAAWDEARGGGRVIGSPAWVVRAAVYVNGLTHILLTCEWVEM